MDDHKKGIILIDILVALSLAILFVGIISESSQGAHDIFTYASGRNQLMDKYEVGEFTEVQQPYGNERLEQTMTVPGGLQYNKVSALSYGNLDDAAGTPLCSVDFIDGSKAPTITAIHLPISSSLPLTHLEVRNGVVYVSADSATASDPDLIVFNILDVNNPTVLSSIDTGPGISAFSIAGKRIYAAAPSTAGQLQVIRMDSLSSLVLEKKFKLPLPYATATPALANSIFYNRNRIYLGTTKWDGDEFNAIDVSNPSLPMKLGGFEIGSIVNDIYVNGGLAYVASADMYQLRILSVEDPLHPTLANQFIPTGWQRQEGKVISMFENSLDYGRTSGGYNVTLDHEAFTWATTSSTTLANPVSIDVPGGVYGVLSDRFHIFLATRQTGKEFQIYDRSLTVNLNSLATSSYSLPVAPQSMACDNDKIYILAHGSPYIYEITFNQ